MSAVNIDLIRKSICATCLSRDRKLFPVNDSKPFAMFCYDLNLSESDAVCWECRHTVIKMAAFKNRALKAQALLTNLQDNFGNIESLSNLICTQINLDYSNLACHPITEVKTEPIFIEPVKQELNDCDEIHGDEVNSEEVEGDKVVGDEVVVDEVCKKKVLRTKRKKTTSLSNEKVIKRKKSIPVKKTPAKEVKEKIKTLDIYTIENLTEEQMLKWRESKRKSEYYMNCAPERRCETCIDPFPTEKSFANHMKRHTEDFGNVICRVCQQRCLDEAALRVHKMIHYRLLHCRFCAHAWDSPNALWAHCSASHGVERAVWHCDLCDREYYSSARNLSKHVSIHQAMCCKECGKSIRAENLKRHMEMHSEGGVKLIRCEVCGKDYRGKSGIKAHMRTHDTKIDEDAFCAQCEVQFRNKYQYHAHLKNSLKHVAKKDLRFKCDQCGKAFLNKPYLKMHIEAIHIRQKTYVCETCGEAFKTKVARRKHERRTHEGMLPERKHVCDYCGKAFKAKTTLLEHINKHTGARPFVCKLCDAAFGQSGALYNHCRLKHNQKKQKINHK